MNAQNINQILDALAQRFGTTAAHLWAVLIRQVYVVGIADAVVEVVLLAICVGAVLVWRALASNGDYEGFGMVAAPGVAALAAVFFVIGIFASINDWASMLNPEYGALQLVLQAVRK